ncbi:MAG: hypothetical protein K0S48_50 [Ramlibacter sp.]|jgi:hypothetical protein|nr:hypothetical protein [Ramlibacter sp.]
MSETAHPGIVKAVWLHLLTEGGRWRHAELADLLGCDRARMDSVLCGMLKRDYLVRFRDNSRKNGVAYGVTPACRIPGGITLQELSASPVATARACEQVRKAWGRPALSAANDTGRRAA